MSADSTNLSLPDAAAAVESRAVRLVRSLRSGVFLSIYLPYEMTAIGLGQRLVVWPAIALIPRRRRHIVRWWLRAHAHATLAMSRVLAGVRIAVRGAIPPESCIAVMNHQSLLDIPLGISLIPGPYPLIPTRDRYHRGIPGIAPLVRLARFPTVSQRRVPARAELLALARAADEVARGEQSLLIFPEGHRTRDGRLDRFMRSGLRLIFSRAKRPVYCIVADGLWRARTLRDALYQFAGQEIRVAILGPFDPPADADIDSFIDLLHDRMSTALAELRTTSGQTIRVADHFAAR